MSSLPSSVRSIWGDDADDEEEGTERPLWDEEGAPVPGEIEFEEDETPQEREVWERAAVVGAELKGRANAERQRALEAPALVAAFGSKDPKMREEAGLTLCDWTSKIMVLALVDAEAHVVAAAAIRGDDAPPRCKLFAATILANISKHRAMALMQDRACAVAAGGAFLMDSDLRTVLEACSVLCEAARRECWGHMFELDIFVNKIGSLLFELCCPMESDEVPRSDHEEQLVPKLFELCWRTREHRYSKAFEKLHKLDVRKSVLTAAISYMFDKRAYPPKEDVPSKKDDDDTDDDDDDDEGKEEKPLCFDLTNRHRLDGQVSHVYPSGLDCAMRTLLGFAEIDYAAIEENDDDYWAHRRLSRIADAARTTRALGPLNPNETITVELLIMTSMQKKIDVAQLRKEEEEEEAKAAAAKAGGSTPSDEKKSTRKANKEPKEQPPTTTTTTTTKGTPMDTD